MTAGAEREEAEEEAPRPSISITYARATEERIHPGFPERDYLPEARPNEPRLRHRGVPRLLRSRGPVRGVSPSPRAEPHGGSHSRSPRRARGRVPRPGRPKPALCLGRDPSPRGPTGRGTPEVLRLRGDGGELRLGFGRRDRVRCHRERPLLRRGVGGADRSPRRVHRTPGGDRPPPSRHGLDPDHRHLARPGLGTSCGYCPSHGMEHRSVDRDADRPGGRSRIDRRRDGFGGGNPRQPAAQPIGPGHARRPLADGPVDGGAASGGGGMMVRR